MGMFTKNDLLRKRLEVIAGRQLALEMGWVDLLEGLDYYFVEPNFAKVSYRQITPYADDVRNSQTWISFSSSMRTD